MARIMVAIACGVLLQGCMLVTFVHEPVKKLSQPMAVPDPLPVIAFKFAHKHTIDGREYCLGCDSGTTLSGQMAIDSWDRVKGNYPILENAKEEPPRPEFFTRSSPPETFRRNGPTPPGAMGPPVRIWRTRSATDEYIETLKPDYVLHLATEVPEKGEAEMYVISLIFLYLFPGFTESGFTVDATLTTPDGNTVIAKGASKRRINVLTWLPLLFIAPFASPSESDLKAFCDEVYTDALNQLSNNYKSYLAKNPPKAEPPAQPASQPPAQPASQPPAQPAAAPAMQ